MRLSHIQLLLCLHAVFFTQTSASASTHTNNWAVLVDTSRNWLNYRHVSNILAIYHTVKRLGISDSHIILMMVDDMACSPRNPYPGTIFNNESHAVNLYHGNIEVDYRGYEVTVENFLRVLTGRHDQAVPRSKRLLSDAGSNILIYMTGHGGNEFIKFQDMGELMAQDLADALQQMHGKQRYNEVLVMVETCEAFTLVSKIKAPNIVATGSSVKGEGSLSYSNDFDIGQPVVDRFTKLTLDFCEALDYNSTATLSDMFSIYTYKNLNSHFKFTRTQLSRPLSAFQVTDFFGSVTPTRRSAQVPAFSGSPIKDDCTEEEISPQRGRDSNKWVELMAKHARG